MLRYANFVHVMSCGLSPCVMMQLLLVMQEEGRRAGTENVLGIVGLGAAAEIVTQEQAATESHMAAMRDDLQERLLRAFPEVICHSCRHVYQRS